MKLTEKTLSNVHGNTYSSAEIESLSAATTNTELKYF